MIKGTFRKDVLKVFEDGNSYYTVVQSEKEILSLYHKFDECDHWIVKKISHRATIPMWKAIKNLDESIETYVYSTGGGFYTAELVCDGYVYTVENDSPLCMNIYNDTDNEEERFMPENMIDSYDINTRELSPFMRNAYEYLIAMLSE